MSGNSWPVKVARQGSGNYSGELSEEQRLQAAGILPMRRSESNNSLPRSASFSGPQNYNLSFSGPLDQPPLPNDPLQALDAQRTAARSLSRTSSGRLVPVDSQGMVRSNSQTLLRTPSGPLSRSNSGQWEPGAIDYGNGTPRTPREEGGWASGGEDGRLPRGRSGPLYGASQETNQERAQRRQQLPRWRTPPRSNSPRSAPPQEVELLPKQPPTRRTELKPEKKETPVPKVEPVPDPPKPNGGLLDRPEEEYGANERTPLTAEMVHDFEGLEMGGGGSALLTDDLKRYLFGAGEDRLLDLVAKFYDTLMDYGLVDTAMQLTSELVEERVVAADLEEDRDLTGIEKLLKHGLLEFLMRIAPLLKPLPAQVIKFKDVIYAARIRPEIDGGITVASSFERAFLGRFRDAVLPRPHQIIPMLDRITGFLMPGSLTLVLGPPGCGKSALHQVLSGRAKLDKNTEKAGEITYNGKPLSALHAKRIAAYIAEQREHLANLSVRETCEFARDCTDAGDHKNKDARQLKELVGDAIAEGQDPRLEVVLQLLGLTAAGNTLLGKGGKGLGSGERLRVTSAEMLAGTYAAYFFDDFTTGLDNGTLYDIVAAIRTMARVFGTTNLFSLQQPPPEVFDLFDRLIMLHEGRVVYQGPREDVLSYFQSLGYIKPPLCDVADFLQEVTTGAGELFLLPGFPKLSSEGFVQAYEQSEYCREVKRVVDSPETNLTLWTTCPHPLGLHLQDTRVGKGALVANLDEEANLRVCSMTFTAPPLPGDQVTGVSGPNGKLEYLALNGVKSATAVEERIERSREPVRLQLERPLPEVPEEDRREYEKEYVQGFFASAATVARRQWAIGTRDLYLTLSRLFLALLLSVITGTIFWQMPDAPSRESYDLRRAVIFAAVLIPVLNSLATISPKFDERQVLYKQRGARFFRVVPYVIADTLVGVPFSVLEVVFFTPFVYFFSGLNAKSHGGHFFIFLLVIFLVSLVGAALVRFMVTVSPTKNRATAATGLVLALFFIFSGFFVVKDKVPKGWIWMYYASPFQWAQTSLVLNEFLSSKYNAICAAQQLAIATYCQKQDERLGRSYLAAYDYPLKFIWVWWGVIALVGFYLLFVFATAWALQRVRFKPKRGRPPTDRKEAAQLGSTSPEHPLSVKYLANQANEPHPLEKIDIRDSVMSIDNENKTMIKAPGILEYVPVTLSFHAIHYDVPVPGTSPDAPKVLLKDVSGFAKPGYITTIMGGPGAGKRILLDVLAGQQKGHITGDILVNGFDRVESTFKRISGYVALQDTLSPYLTVEETLRFSARLRLPSDTLEQHLQAFIEEVMEVLELTSIRNFLVGTPTRVGLGIEQIKRVSIATELAANPSIIFFDEPTAGLDSRGAQRLMRGIRNIANTGRTIVMTSHQPSARLFSAFDMLLLLKFGGETVFFGPIGPDGENVVKYFEAIPGTVSCGENQNPASYIMEVIGAGITRVAHREYAIDYKKSELYDVNAEELDTLRWSKGEAGPDFSEEGYAAPLWRRQREVTKRAIRIFWRNVNNSFGRALLGILLALVLGSLCFRIGQDSTAGMVSRVGVIYLAVSLFGLMNAVIVVLNWNKEQPMYLRERNVSAYSAGNYSFAWGLAELPFLLVTSFIFSIIVYGMADISLNSATNFVTSLAAIFLYTLAMVYFGLLVAEVALNAKIAAVIVTFFATLWSLTSGYLVSRSRIPDFYVWLFWLNPLQYAFNCLTSVAFYCDTTTPSCITAGCLIDGNACPQCSCQRLLDHPNYNRITWPVVRGEWSLTYSRRGYDLLALVAFIILFKALAILAFRIFRKTRKL